MWWKAAICVAIVMSIVTGTQLRNHLRQRYLLENGEPVTVIVKKLNNRGLGTGSYRPLRDEEHYVNLEGPMKDGRTFIYNGMIGTAPGHLELGGEMQLRVDPKDLTRWVEVRPPRSLWEEFMAVFLLMPIIVILLAVAQWQRMGVLRVWKQGKVREAIVVDCKHSSIAPRSRVCRYTLADGEDRRVFTTLFPSRQGVPQPGETLHMIVNHDEPGRALAAELYVRQQTA